MSQLPTEPSFLTRAEKAARTDAAVAATRAATPPEVAERRLIERASIEELNAMSWEDVRERYNKSSFDDRPAYVKVLDVIDLPRNALFNLVAPGLAKNKEAAGDTATFGLGRVNFSDVLAELGVDNHIVRGVLGFVGDVAFDPLTYVGGAGVGARLAGAGGKASIQVSKRGAKALRQGIKAASEGRPVTDDAVRTLIESAGFNQRRIASRLERGVTPDQLRSRMDAVIRGAVPRETAERQKLGLGRIFGRGRGEGLIGRRLYDQIPEGVQETARTARRQRQIDAARGFVRQYERSTGEAVPAIRVRGGGTQVAHIPFTDLNLQVPGFRRSATTAQAQGRIARTAAVGGSLSAIPDFTEVAGLAQDAERAVNAIEELGPQPKLEAPFNKGEIRTRIEQEIGGPLVRDTVGKVTHQTTGDLLDSVEDSLRGNQVEGDYLAFLTRVHNLDRAGELNKAEHGAVRGLDSSRLNVDDSWMLGSREARVTAADDASVTITIKDPDETVPITAGVDMTTPGRERTYTIPRGKPIPASAGTLTRSIGGVAEDPRALEFDALDDINERLQQITAARQSAPDQPETVEQALLLMNEREAVEASRRRLAARIKQAKAGDDGEFADALHKVMAANRTLADVTNSSLIGLLSSKDKAVLNTVQAAIGTSDALIGSSLLTDMASAINGSAGWRQRAAEGLYQYEKSLRARFGRRAGTMRAAIRQAERMRELGADRESKRMAMRYRSELRRIAAKHDLGDDQVDELARLTQALAYAAREAENPGAYFTTPYKQGGRNAFTVIEEAKAAGLLKNEALVKDLQGLSTETNALLDTLGEIAEEGDLIRAREGFVPLVQSRVGREATGESQTFIGFQRQGPGLDPASRKEGFQRTRTTDQYRFPREDGSEARFFEYQRAWKAKYPQSALREMEARGPEGAARAANIRQTIADIDAYDDLDDAVRAEYPPRPTDFEELNDLIADGMFADITLNQRPAAFFDSNIINVMSAYAGMTQRAHARRVLREIVDETGLDLHTRVEVAVDPVTGRKTVRLPGGATAELVAKPGQPPTVVLPDGSRFRQLDLPKDSVLNHAFGGVDGARDKWIEDSVAGKIEEAAKLLSPQADRQWMQTLDRMVGSWKTITLIHPSWIISEVIGNSMLAVMALGENFRHFLPNYRRALRVILNENNPEKLRGMTVNVGGQQIDGERFLEIAFQNGIKEAGAESEMFAQAARGKKLRLPSPADAFKGRDAEIASLNADIAAKKGTVPAAEPTDGLMRRFVAPWFNANRKSNDAIRLAVFMSFMDAGYDVQSAAEATMRGMYDFGDLTHFERGIRRYAFPFYSWLRANAAHQTMMLFERPAFAAAMPKVQDAIETMIAGEQQVPQNLRPGWMREQLAIQIGKDPDARWSILSRALFPQADAVEMLQPALGLDGAQKFLHYFAGSLNPVLKAPLEIGAGAEFFSGRSIGASAEEADLSIPEYLLGQIRPFRELGVGSIATGPIQRQFGQSLTSGLARLTLGGRAQDFGAERLDRGLLRDLKDQERRLRIAIARAEREKNEPVSLDARVKLLKVYRRMLDAGLEEDVPRWAQIQLDRIAANE